MQSVVLFSKPGCVGTRADLPSLNDYEGGIEIPRGFGPLFCNKLLWYTAIFDV